MRLGEKERELEEREGQTEDGDPHRAITVTEDFIKLLNWKLQENEVPRTFIYLLKWSEDGWIYFESVQINEA